MHSGGPIVWLYGCSTTSANDALYFNASTKSVYVEAGGRQICFGLEDDDPAGGRYQYEVQAWAKPLSGTRGVALSVINPHAGMTDVTVPLYALPLTGAGINLTTVSGAIGVRDIWARQDLPDLPPPQGVKRAVSLRVVGMNSAFVRLSPK